MITLSTPPTKQEAEAIVAAGRGTLVAHPRAGSKRGRDQLRTQLGRVGVPTRIAMTLAWTTDAGPAPEAVVVVESQPEPGPIVVGVVDGEVVEATPALIAETEAGPVAEPTVIERLEDWPADSGSSSE